jgi:magnesium chelatase family protein
MVQKYLNRISGPLLDRIDIHIEVVPVPFNDLSANGESEKSAVVRERVIRARAVQTDRFKNIPDIYCNAQMNSSHIKRYCDPGDKGRALLKNAIEILGLSARAYDRILKVSRTIADLEESDSILPMHLSEAINYRSLDREGWAG